MLADGQRRWRSWQELAVNADDFEQVADDFSTATATATGSQRSAAIGWSSGHLLPVRELVDYAAGWLPIHRRA